MNKVLSVLLLGSVITVSASAQNLVSYWDQNSNNLAGGGFGFIPADFPQAADLGSGTITLSNFDTSTETGGDYSYIQSFGGTTTNAFGGASGGGSLAPQGGPDGGGGNSNNGMSIDFNISTVGFEGISISWAQRGTGSGFDSRAFSYSSNGGGAFTPVATDSGTLSSSWETESYDLSAITALDNNANVVLRITLDGATGTTGNNRFDNILITAAVPEPSTYAAIIGLIGLGLVLVRRRR